MARRSARLREQLFAHFPVAWRWLHVFLPLASRYEPATGLISRRLWAGALPPRLAASAVQADDISLRHYELTSATPLVANCWGIPEPVANPATEVAPARLDAVLVPLLACDQQGQRVGYGGGYTTGFWRSAGPRRFLLG